MTVTESPTDPARRARHREFLRGHLIALAVASPAVHRDHGRGAWLMDYSPPAEPAPANVRYFADARACEHPQGWPSQTVKGMVDGYDPRRECVVLVCEPDGTTSAYTMSLPVPVGRDS